MTVPALRAPRRWRVAVTRDEAADGPLSRALDAAPLRTVAVPGAGRAATGRSRGPRPHRPPPGTLRLDRLRQRAIGARAGRGPADAVAGGHAHRGGRPSDRAGVAVEAGTTRPPLVADGDGAEALWARLRDADAWPGRRVLLPTTPGGRRGLADALPRPGRRWRRSRRIGWRPGPPAAIAGDWQAAAPDAAVIASPRVATVLVGVLGAGGVARSARPWSHRPHHRRRLDGRRGGGSHRRRGRLHRRGAHAGRLRDAEAGR